MTRQHRCARYGTPSAYGGRAGHADARRHGCVIPDSCVMTYHDLVIELYAISQYRILEGSAIDRRIGTDFYIVANQHTANLGDFRPGTGLLYEDQEQNQTRRHPRLHLNGKWPDCRPIRCDKGSRVRATDSLGPVRNSHR